MPPPEYAPLSEYDQLGPPPPYSLPERVPAVVSLAIVSVLSTVCVQVPPV